MSDKIVSVRMPESLLGELRELAGKNHYMDVSEEIRSIVRDKWVSVQDPYGKHLSDIRKDLSKATIPTHVVALKGELRKLLEDLENG